MAAIPKLVDQLIEILERERLKGLKYVEISRDNLDYLYEEKREKPLESKPTGTARNELKTIPTIGGLKGGQSKLSPATKYAPSFSTFENGQKESQKDLPVYKPISLKPGVSTEELENLVHKCTQCRLCNTRNQAVFGHGSATADLMLIGDRPSLEDDVNGFPFSDNVGELLNKIVKAMRLSRDQVYVTNIVKCSPPGKRSPADGEALTCLPYVQREIELLEPRVIVLLGAAPLKYLLNKRGIAEYRGQWFKFKDIDCIPTYHPSYLLRVPKAKRDVWNDMQQVMKRLQIKRSI